MNIIEKYLAFLKWFYKNFLGAHYHQFGKDDNQRANNMEYSIYHHWADANSSRLYDVLLSMEKYLGTDDYSKDIEELIRPCLDFGPTLKLSLIPLYKPIVISIVIALPLFFITTSFLPPPVTVLIFVFPFMVPAMYSLLELIKVTGLISSVSSSLIEYDKNKDSNLHRLSNMQRTVFLQWLKENFKFFSKHKYLHISRLYSGKVNLKSGKREFYAFYIEVLEKHTDKDGKDSFETIDSFFGIRMPGFNMTEARICSLKQKEDGLQPWTSLSPRFNERYCCEVADSIAATKWLTPATLEEILDADIKLGALEIMTTKDGHLLTLFKKNIFAEKQSISTTLKTPSAFLNDLLVSDQSSENLPIALSLIDLMIDQ
ncbi:hypothetical protein [Gynuella sp.]|uniref:hypothetical protein n=1 Tax=Gynuella sp. TaxID=2969146 RepID=UPI003D0E8AE5